MTLASLPLAPWPVAASRVYVSVHVAFKPALLTAGEQIRKSVRDAVSAWVALQAASVARTGACEKLTDTRLDLLVSVLKDNVGILLADEVVIFQELSRDPADSVDLTAGCHSA